MTQSKSGALAPRSGYLAYCLLKLFTLIYISAVFLPKSVQVIRVDFQRSIALICLRKRPRAGVPSTSLRAGPRHTFTGKSRSLMRTTLRFIFCLAILLSIRQFALAQGAATGDLHVTVKDPKGGVVTNATVTVRDVAKGLERAGSGDGQGGYSVRQLAPGTYTVIGDSAGFCDGGSDRREHHGRTDCRAADRADGGGGQGNCGGDVAGGAGGNIAHLDDRHDRRAEDRRICRSTGGTTSTSR